jgi:outer membrane receptor for ferrienterochelin and colicins
MFRKGYWGLLVALVYGLSARAQQSVVTGQVMDEQGPVAFANVSLEGSSAAAATGPDGRFSIVLNAPGNHVLVVAALTHERLAHSFSVAVGQQKDLGQLRLASTTQDLDEVVVTGSLKPMRRSDSPIAVEVVTPALFRKNPSPTLFEAVGMVNGVRPQINCSVCNTGDIHINGMEGPYTLVMIDGMPIVSGLSSVYGLSGIPTSLIERVEVVKGPGSALYGSEAMGGIINVITKDPALAPKASGDLMATSWQEYNADVGVKVGNGQVSDLIGVNLYHYDDPRDNNGDGFTDVTLQKRISVFNKVKFQRAHNRTADVAGRYVYEDRWGGQMEWTPEFAGGDSVYGEYIRTRRWEFIGQYQLPMKEEVVLQFSANGHQQRSFYGTTTYNADQYVYFGQLHWRKRLSARHHLLSGLSYRLTDYDDNTPATYDSSKEPGHNAPSIRALPGLFAQDEWSLTDVHKLLLGFRADHDLDHGWVGSPRLAYKWMPSGRWTVRANFGTGFRVVNLFTEDHAALTGARRVVIAEHLRPERSLNGLLNIVRRWPGEKRFFGLDGSLFYSYYSNQILPDYTTDQDLIIYSNLSGHAVSRGVSLNAESRLGKHLRILAGGTWMQVFSEGQGVRADLYFAPKWSSTFTVSQELPKNWTLDLTGQVYGPMRVPVQPNDYRPEYSPEHALLNIQAKHKVNDQWEIYGGVKNLLNFVPNDPLMQPFDPFDKAADDPVGNPYGYTFDPSYIYAPLQGVRGFLGVRYVLG